MGQVTKFGVHGDDGGVLNEGLGHGGQLEEGEGFSPASKSKQVAASRQLGGGAERRI